VIDFVLYSKFLSGYWRAIINKQSNFPPVPKPRTNIPGPAAFQSTTNSSVPKTVPTLFDNTKQSEDQLKELEDIGSLDSYVCVNGLSTSTMIVDAGFIPPFFHDSQMVLSPIKITDCLLKENDTHNDAQFSALECTGSIVFEDDKVCNFVPHNH
jgi:hypothetical protein